MPWQNTVKIVTNKALAAIVFLVVTSWASEAQEVTAGYAGEIDSTWISKLRQDAHVDAPRQYSSGQLIPILAAAMPDDKVQPTSGSQQQSTGSTVQGELDTRDGRGNKIHVHWNSGQYPDGSWNHNIDFLVAPDSGGTVSISQVSWNGKNITLGTSNDNGIHSPVNFARLSEGDRHASFYFTDGSGKGQWSWSLN